MGYVSPGMVAKKHYNWKVPEIGAVPPTGLGVTLRDALADIQYFAQYQADFADVQAFSAAPSGFDAGETGSNLVLSGADSEIVTINGEGASLTVQDRGPPPPSDTYVFEMVVNSLTGSLNVGLYSTGGPPFDPETMLSNNAFCAYITHLGDVFGAFGAPGVPANIGALQAGDVIGVVFRSDPSGAFFYVNGVGGAEASLANNAVRGAVSGSP